jgi:RHS repeat-associated protein
VTLNTSAAGPEDALALDDEPLSAAPGASFAWATTAHADGPHTLALGAAEASVDILNDPNVVVHGGRLEASETWDAARLHLVRNWVAVPSGVTLTVEAGAVVKFCRYAGLLVEPGGVVLAVGTAEAPIFLTHVADGTLGGDANPDTGDETPGLNEYGIEVRGTLTLSPHTQVRHRSTVPGYPQITIGDRIVDEKDGTVRVPVSLSAAAPTTIRVSWRTEDGTATAGEDYEGGSGVLTWAAGQSARQFITLPIIVAGENKPVTETFFVQLEDTYAATIARERATVWIMDNTMAATDTGDLAFVAVESPPCRLDLRESFEARIAQGNVDLRYDAAWRAGATAVRVSVNGVEVAVGAAGVYSWDTTAAAEAVSDVALTWLDADGEAMAAVATRLYVLNGVDLHRGRLAADETWGADRVHLVLGPVIVPAGVTLTIEPGAVVKFSDGAGLTVETGGTVVANGAIFTHIADDSVGGDSNLDGDATLPVPDAYALSGNVVTDAATQLRFTSQTASGTISTSQTWLSGRTYKVTGNLTVASGATLTILPGAVVKMGDNLSLTVNSGGTLTAIGNRALPIIFTSHRDDAHGGDTNGDGNLTVPQAGNWHQIRAAGGAVRLAHVRVLYCSNANNQGGLYMTSGVMEVDNAWVAHALFDCVRVTGGQFTARNGVFSDSSMGFAPVGGSSLVVNCVFYDLTTAVRWPSGVFVNCVFARISSVFQEWGPSTFQYCCFHNASGYGPQSESQVGTNGNIWGDPRFTDPANGDFTLLDGSPLIDAGDGAVAPEFDFFGRPRMAVHTVPDTGTLAANGACPDIGIYEAEGEVTTPRPDLCAVSITGTATATAGGTVTVEWETGNAGVAPAVGPWRDVIAISAADPLLGSQTVKLGEFVAPGPIPVGETRSYAATFTVPPVSAGAWKFRIHVNAYRDVFEPLDATNNLMLSETTLTVASPALGLGTSPVALPPGASAGFRLNGLDGAGGTVIVTAGPGVRVLGASGYMPSGDRFQWTATDLGDGRLLLSIPPGFAADGLFLALINDTAAPVSLSVETRLPVRELFGVSRGRFPNTGEAAFTAFGAGWSNAATARLAQGALSIPARALACEGNGIRLAFAVQGRTPGTYDLLVEEGGDSRTLPGAIELTQAGRGPEWHCNLVLQDASRAGRESAGRFTYGNRGDTEMPAPYVSISSQSGNVLVKFDTKDYWQTGSLEFMAGSATWPASLLKPGESRAVDFRYYIVPNTSGAATLSYTFTTASDEPFPWNANAAAMRPTWMSDEMWGFTLAAMRGRIGETWNDWLERMRAGMDYLADMGQPTQRLAPLWQMEINTALNADGPLATLAAATDARRAGRGLSLAFSRWYGAALHQRFQTGILGTGWAHNFDIRLERSSDGKQARIRYPGGGERAFEKNDKAPGLSMPTYDNVSVLARGGDILPASDRDGGDGGRSGSRLSLAPLWTYWSPTDTNDRGRYWESSSTSQAYIEDNDGSTHRFDLASGRLLGVHNGKGQTLTCTYTGGLLTRVTHTDGQFLEFAYAGGRLVSVTDDTGRVVQYGYTGPLLTSVTAFDGRVTRYAYASAPGTVRDKALTQVAHPDGTTLDYAYDDWGAVAAVSRNGSEQTVQYIWEGAGVSSVVDAAGAAYRVWRGARGEILAASDPLGRRSRYAYDATTRRLVATTAPGGERTTIAYDNDLRPIRTVNPLGFATEFTYNLWNGDLTSLTDARGQRLSYTYGTRVGGHLTAITYPDSTAETYTNAANGDVLGFRNRRAEDIVYGYDALGRTTRKEMPDGRVFTYTYDAKGNLTEATDSLTGTIALEYDAAERLVAITYPDGRGFAYTYDDAGRRATRTAHDGHRLVYEYDALGRFAALADGTRNAVVRYTYDEAVGRLVRQDYGNGTYTLYSYDLAGQLTGLAHHAADGTPFEQIAYTYDVNGRRTGMTTAAGSHSYRYDATGQLLGATAPGGANETFAYDPVGNRLAANGTAYTVNALNQYTAAGAATFAYDADGNLVTRTDAEGVTTYTYDAESRLVGVARPDGSQWRCTYDALGNRVEVDDNGAVTRYVFDPVGLTDLASEYDGAGNLVRRYLHAGWLAADETAAGARRYYHADALSSTRLLTDATGAVVATRDYTAFGQLKADTGEATPFGYVGGLGVLQEPTGLLFMRNRYYAPGEGRFVQMDPIGINAGDVNSYRYASNAPYSTADPSGLWGCTISIGPGMVGFGGDGPNISTVTVGLGVGTPAAIICSGETPTPGPSVDGSLAYFGGMGFSYNRNGFKKYFVSGMGAGVDGTWTFETRPKAMDGLASGLLGLAGRRQ